MKRLRSAWLLVLLLLPGVLLAQRAAGVLRVRFDDRSPVTIAVNGRHFQKAGRALTIGDLPRGRSYVKVYAFRAYKEGGGGHAKLVYAGNIRIRPGMVTYCIVERSTGRALIYTRDPGGSNTYYDPEFDDNTTQPSSTAPPPLPTPSAGDEAPAAAADRMAAADPPRQPFLNKEMKDLQKRVDDRIAGPDKLLELQDALAEKSVTTAQVKQMLSWLGYEPTRLEFAKWAYDHVSDPQQYPQIAAVFTYESSKEDFSRYISGKQ